MSDTPSRTKRRRPKPTPADAGSSQPQTSPPLPSAGPDGVEPCGVPDPYARQLPPGDLRAYQNATADLDLSDEIRLMRAVLACLAGDVEENHAAMTRVLQTLLRAIHLHGRQSGGSGELVRALDDVGEQVLNEGRNDIP